MKRIFYTLICFSLMLQLQAQTEKIGINTTSPDETVHVIGDIILLESPDGTKKVMLRTSGASGELIWELALDTSTIVYDGGKVVVGSTANPQELDVTDNVTFRGELHMSSLGGANPTFKMVDNGTTFYMGPVRNGSDYYIQTTKDLIFRTSGNSYSNKLVIKNDGKVGIGDGVTPATLTEALTVDGAVNILRIILGLSDTLPRTALKGMMMGNGRV